MPEIAPGNTSSAFGIERGPLDATGVFHVEGRAYETGSLPGPFGLAIVLETGRPF
ncbi:bsl3676 [Bradyrhizobium diazoefficiens USDA 110]|uniref:Bsl3676 protein n=1 Tax=Bradyrhizobium diazoefficiens (strain JCM 10833 / BCRC 13528 / IAM 13628 / NBRC 14792 / USDA 110) TaxID=224911 RepID=Q89P07_BRADU|nr:hypothetical protein Bdiaspc4_18970 [Bradyrhizobium diazoefficiens]QHP74338.1 hypothetical protein EI171_31185 [Bradyrhizobium sp. LCT2]BAC48941.1 bsl3676 [Bradyrhizobium diazoefficiens USDA 110]